MPTGTVKFERKCIAPKDFPDWIKSTSKFKNITVKTEGTIEEADDCAQADFANAFIGGSVLSYGCVQEEIRFMINPECCCSRLFMEYMQDNEAIVIIGGLRN